MTRQILVKRSHLGADPWDPVVEQRAVPGCSGPCSEGPRIILMLHGVTI